MNDAIWVALIVAVPPVIVTFINNHYRKKEREEDRADRAKLVQATEEVKATAANTETVVTAKLDVIHDLVNSDKTEGLKALRTALASSLWWMRREAARLEGEGKPVPSKVNKEIEDTETALSELDGVLAEREKTQQAIDAEHPDVTITNR